MLLNRNGLDIIKFLETNPERRIVYGCEIEKAEDFLKNDRKNTKIIVTFKKSCDAVMLLEKHGYERFKDYVLYDDIVDCMIGEKGIG